MVQSDSFFYNEMWTQWRDDLLIRSLDFHSCYDKTQYNAGSTQIFETVLAFQHSWKRLGITAEEIAKRFVELEERYNTWKSIIERADVVYNIQTNKVSASKGTWTEIYQEYKLGGLYSNAENEHLWDELCGIFGPDSVRAARNAMITPYPQSKLKWKRERESNYAEDSDNEWIEIPFDEVEPTEIYEPVIRKQRVPKGHICPYPGDWIMNKSTNTVGASSTADSTKGDKKKGKSKRFLDF